MAAVKKGVPKLATRAPVRLGRAAFVVAGRVALCLSVAMRRLTQLRSSLDPRASAVSSGW